MSDFNIEGSITEDDIPPTRRYVKSKYDPIYKSCKTLQPDEGIKISVEKNHVRAVVEKGLKSRHPRRHYDLATRKNKRGGYHLYIVRKS